MTASDSVPQGTQTVLAPVNGSDTIFSDLLGGAISNFDGEPMHRMKLDMLAAGSKCADKDKEDGTEFEIKYFYVHRIEILNPKTGELTQAVRTVLVNPKLDTIDFCSEGVAKSLAIIVKNMGMGPYLKPIVVKIRERKTSNNRRMTDLIPIG